MTLFNSRRVAYIFSGCVAVLLAACQGNLGSSSGLSIPQAPGYGQPGGPGPGGVGTQSRQQVLEGAVYLTPSTTEVPLPPLDGFSVSLELGTPPPSAEPGASSAPAQSSAAPAGAAAHVRSPILTRQGPARLVAAVPAASPSAAPSPSGSAAPSPGPHPSASAPGPHASASAAAKIDTKTIVYPDDAPVAPTPEPTGNVQTFVKRTAIVRGYVMPAQDLTLYGLGALRFTIPGTEELPQRGFTVAIFASGKKRHSTLIESDTEPSLANDVVASARTSSPIVLKKNVGYLLMLYGDEAPATPAPVQAGYPTPGNNPFPMPSTYGSAAPGYPQPPYPGGPVNPNVTPTPFH